MSDVPDSSTVFVDEEFRANNNVAEAEKWARIGELYPQGTNLTTLLPDKFSRDQFEQGDHFECFMLTAYSVLINHPDTIRNCFLTKNPRQDGRYRFQFFRFDKWEAVEIDDTFPLVEGDTVFIRSPTKHWWPLLLEKAYAKFYSGYAQIEGCTLQEALHDISGNPVMNVPLEAKLAAAAGAQVNDGAYWLDLTKKIRTGQLGVTALTKRDSAEQFGMRDEQTYGIQEVVSLNGGMELVNLLVHLYSPFEEDQYTGPMKEDDKLWTPALKAQFDPSRKNSIFLPILEFLRIFGSLQVAYLKMVDNTEAVAFPDAWVANSTAGGNPTLVSWRNNPMYLVRNTSDTPATIIAQIRQEDQRAGHDPENDQLRYQQCGLVLSQATFKGEEPIATRYVCGNNHKSVHKGLFLNSREVANSITVPPKSLCYLVPTGMQRTPGKFVLGVFFLKGSGDKAKVAIERAKLDNMAWDSPAMDELDLHPKSKDRVDFYVDAATDIHILLTQRKPFALKSGGDNMTEDFCGMYLYNDTDKKIAGVAAATNFRETSLIHTVPSSGRYALSVTCPKGSGEVPITVTIVGSPQSRVRIVDPPADAKDLAGDDDDDDEDEVSDLIDYVPRTYPDPPTTVPPDSDTPFEDRQFYMDNKDVTDHKWIHITDLYPSGKRQPLLPQQFKSDQFEQGDHFECFMLTALSTLVRHPNVIRNCFVTQEVRRDGRYIFRFFRYGQWHFVEIDDRIPVVENNQTVFIRSPTEHWWPLLLEKAHAKFYNRYANVEGCTLQEALHDLAGKPVLNIPFDEKLALAAGFDISDPNFWLDLGDKLDTVACTALTRRDLAEPLGMRDEQTYGISGIVRSNHREEATLDSLLIRLYCPFVEDKYTGPMNEDDTMWTGSMLETHQPQKSDIIMPVSEFARVFASMQMCQIRDVVQPCYSFHSKWDETCSGGNPIFTSWKTNPQYIVENKSDEPIQMAFIVRQPDQRATIHVKNQEPQYIQCGIVMVQSNYKQPFPTHLMTSNNHRSVHKGLFLNSREVSNLVTVPPKSLCYLVPSPLQRGAQGRFMLSYQFLFLGDDQHVTVRRHKSAMAIDKPAIDELELVPRSKDRVDFEVDCAGEVHVLMSQLKPHQMKSGGDSMTEDYCGLYMYNDKNKKITGVAAATNYRDTGVVYQVPAKGRYALSVTCPKGAGKIPLRVTVVAIAAAHVRIVDPPDDAEEFMEVDLSFLDQEPEGVPIEVLNLDDDEKFESMLKQLKLYYKSADANKTQISKLEREMNLWVHILAKRYIANERSKFLNVPNGYTLATFNPMLDDDETFTKMEVSRFELKKNPRNATKVVTVERNLNSRALEIANENSNPDRGWIGKDVRGVPIDLLPLEDHAELKELEKKLRSARRGQTNKAEVEELEQSVRETIEEIADSYISHHRRALNQDAYGVPIKKLPIEDDQQFRDLEIQRYRLVKQDPKKNERGIKELEAKLNNRSLELADSEAAKDRTNVLDAEYHGIAVGQLNLAGDAAYMDLQRKRMALVRSGGDEAKIRELENKMRRRAEELALGENEKDRYGIIGKNIDGAATDKLDLSNDALFLAAEARRARLKRSGGSAAEIQQAENDMRSRAQQIVKQRMTGDRGYLAPQPEGVPIALLPLDTDAEFCRLEAERFALKSDPKKSAAKIQAQEEELNGRARILAREYKQRGRSNLRSTYLGIPLDDLPLDTDEDMRELESEKRNLGSQHLDTVKEIDDAMHERALVLAQAMHAEERKIHDQEPDGVPIDDLKLNDNKAFIDVENQARRLRKDPKKNAAKVKDLEADLNRMLKAASRAAIEADREFLDPEPRGIPLNQLPFEGDAKFKQLERERRQRRKKSGSTSAPDVIRLEDEMNERIMELADEYISNDRGYLPNELEGVPTGDVPVGSDDTFRALEVERSKLKANKGSSKAIQDSEGKLVTRGKALALEMLARERNDFNPQPAGVSLATVLPIAHQDKQFRSLENQRRKKRREKNEDAWSDLTGEAGTRIEELAREAIKGERKQYLNKEYEGVPTAELPLDRDEQFRDLEAERFEEIKKPKPDTRRVVDAEKKIHARANEIAKQYLESDLDSFLAPEPRGVLLSELPLDGDKGFQEMKRERARLKSQDASKNSAKIAELQQKMNARCDALAFDALKKDRPKFVENEPRGVPLEYLGIDNDPHFVELERKRWRMKRKGSTKSPEFQEIEDELGDYIDEMAEEYIRKEREFLDPNPDGVPLEFLAIDDDATFKALEKERRPLLLPEEASKSRKKAQDLEQKMSDLAVKRARQHVQKDRAYMEPEPEGIPLADLPVDTDKEVYEGERKRQQLKRDAALNATGIADTEDAVNDRLVELAMRLYEKDRAYLDPEPEEVPLSNLPLNTDEEFRKSEIARRKCKANGEDKRAKELEGKLNQRAHVLAKEWLANDRGYLDPEPEGVLLEYLPLHIDSKFRELEKQRAKMRKAGGDVADIEDNLNDRAHFLAKELIAKERARILKPEYLSVPREYLPFDANKEFRDVEKRRRAAERKKKDAEQDRLLQNDMNDFAGELAEQYLIEEREFLTPEPEGVPLKDIGLDEDNLFKRMELDRRKRRHEPNAAEDDRIGEIEGKMSNRAHELARQLILGDRAFLNPEPHGVQLEYLPLDTDGKFQKLENERRQEKRKPDASPMEMKELEDAMNDRAHELAKEFLAREREYLDKEPEGVPVDQLKLHLDKPFRTMELERRKLRKDPAKNEKKILEFEDRLNERARQLAREQRGYQDDDFHARNIKAGDRWVRISQLYPEGQNDKLLPDRPSGADVESAPEGAGFLAPFLAAMTRNFPLFHAMVETKVPNKREPFVFHFHHPTNGRTKIEIDDRVPVGKDGEPKYTRAPNRHWFPILIEKAYAKFRGGYRSLDHVTPHEVLRDLTGKPVTHIPLEKKLARAAGADPTQPKFWRGLRDDIAKGDIVTAMSIWEAPDGIHKQSSYAIMAVVDTIEGSTDPNDIFVRLHNSYRYAPYYSGPMHVDDRAWTPELVQLCKYDRSRNDTLFLPVPVFLRNFVSVQKCHANSGEPTMFPGEWDARTCGGNPNATGFRNNPIYILENRGSRPTQVVLELRHKTPMQAGSIALSDDDDDAVRKRRRVREEKEEDGARSYPQTGIMVVQATTPFTIPTELIAWNAFKSIHKSMVLDSRELSFSFYAPPTTTCFVIPYTLRRGVTGMFDIAMYPFQGLFSFSPLNTAVIMQKPLEAEFDVPAVMDGEGVRLDFLCDDTSELHLIVQQTMPYDAGKSGDLHAANVLQMTLYDANNAKLMSTGEPSDYREQVIITRQVAPGRYALLFLSTKGQPPMFPVRVQIFASRKANLRWTPLPANAKPLVQSRFPMLPKSAPVKKEGPEYDDRVDGPRRGSAQVNWEHGEVQIHDERVRKPKQFSELPVLASKPKPPPKKVYAFGTSSPRKNVF